MAGIEHTFPYGHPEHRPPDPADVAALVDLDPATVPVDRLGPVLDGLEAAQRQLDAVRLGVLGEYEHRGAHTHTGATDAATALGRRHGLDPRALRRELRSAAKLRQLPLAAKTLTAGRITADHIQALTGVMTARTETAVIADEARLVAMAERLDVDRYRRALRFWKAHADPDGTHPGEATPSEWWCSTSLDGVFTKGRFDGEAGATLARAVDRMVDELHRAEGDGPDGEGRRVPAAQRRAEALVELVRRGAGLDADLAPARRTRPQIVVTIDHDHLRSGLGLGVTDTAQTLTAGAVRRLACDAEVIAAVFGTDSELVDLGRRARLVTPAQRMALTLRDGGCVHPACDRPADWCDAHHIRHWTEGGPSDLDNLCLLCSFHHHLVHEGRWTVCRDPDGRLEFADPHGDVLPASPATTGRPDPWRRDPPDRPPPEPEPPARGAPFDEDRT